LGTTTQQLMCGQTLLCGSVSIDVEATGYVTVTVTAAPGWTFSSSAMFVGAVAGGGFPGAVPGQYPLAPTATVAGSSYSSGRTAVPCLAGDAGKSYVVAVSVHVDANGGSLGGGQTGWARGPIAFPLAKWGWYSNACVPCTSTAVVAPAPSAGGKGNTDSTKGTSGTKGTDGDDGGDEGGDGDMPVTVHTAARSFVNDGDDEQTDSVDNINAKIGKFNSTAHGNSAKGVKVTVTDGASAQGVADAIKLRIMDDGGDAEVEVDDDDTITITPKGTTTVGAVSMSAAQLQAVASVAPVLTDAAAASATLVVASQLLMLIAFVLAL